MYQWDGIEDHIFRVRPCPLWSVCSGLWSVCSDIYMRGPVWNGGHCKTNGFPRSWLVPRFLVFKGRSRDKWSSSTPNVNMAFFGGEDVGDSLAVDTRL